MTRPEGSHPGGELAGGSLARVQAPTSLLDRLCARDIVFVTGKGGVGKTTVAAALGTAAAGLGLRTIVAEVAARGDAGRRLGPAEPAVFEEREVAPGLFHISVDPDHALEEYLVDQLPVKAAADALARSRIFTYLTAATPGMRELLTVGKLWELAQPVRRTPGAAPYDLVVVDAPATGHGLALLAAPRTFAETARVGPIAHQGRTIDEMLSDPARTGVLAVTTPEETPVSETLLLRRSLREQTGLDVDAVLVNGLLGAGLTRAEAAAARAALTTPAGTNGAGRLRRAALRAATAHDARTRSQRVQVARLRRGLGAGAAEPAPPLRTLPVVADAAAVVPELARRIAR